MKQAILIVGIIFISFLAVFNCSMTYEGDGMGLWISAIFSTLGFPLPLVLMFIRTNSKWVSATRIVALVTFGLPILISEYHSAVSKILEYTLLPLNVVLLTLCVISVVSEAKTNPSKVE